MNKSNQAILNYPFEFQEVLIGRDTRKGHLQATALEGAFGAASTPALPANTPVRQLSVRLRTINNACEAPFRLADGRPVTEVSLYGSRDRQLLVGPYWAVVRLMGGDLPSDVISRWLIRIDEACRALEESLQIVDAFLSNPTDKFTAERIAAAQERRLAEAQKLPPGTRLLFGNEPVEHEVRRQQRIDLRVERIEQIQEFSRSQHGAVEELKSLRDEVASVSCRWWWEWTDEFRATLAKVRELESTCDKQAEGLRETHWPHRWN